MPDIDALLFDLDGTLADTGPDMAAAINALRTDEGRTSLPYSVIRPWVSHGARALVALGFDVGETDPSFEDLRLRFLDHYQQNLCLDTKLFDGMELVLTHCEERGIHWGIVTNKPRYLTEPLVEHLGLAERAACVVSGDSLSNRKPHPDPLLHACRLIGRTPNRSVYIGDASRDVEAGNSAGMVTLVATFGYLGDTDQPDTWGADGLIDTPSDIITWLNTGAWRPALTTLDAP
jgi:phosphoglycolate phosphatase